MAKSKELPARRSAPALSIQSAFDGHAIPRYLQAHEAHEVEAAHVAVGFYYAQRNTATHIGPNTPYDTFLTKNIRDKYPHNFKCLVMFYIAKLAWHEAYQVFLEFVTQPYWQQHFQYLHVVWSDLISANFSPDQIERHSWGILWKVRELGLRANQDLHNHNVQRGLYAQQDAQVAEQTVLAQPNAVVDHVAQYEPRSIPMVSSVGDSTPTQDRRPTSAGIATSSALSHGDSSQNNTTGTLIKQFTPKVAMY